MVTNTIGSTGLGKDGLVSLMNPLAIGTAAPVIMHRNEVDTESKSEITSDNGKGNFIGTSVTANL